MSKTRKSERTRTEILDAAWALIAERGVEVSLSEIADAVGMTRQSIYVHFGSRGGLLVALVRRADDRADIRRKFGDALATRDARERFSLCLKVWFDFVPEIYPVASDLVRLRLTDKEAGDAWEDRMSELREVFEELMRGLKRDNVLADHWIVRRAADFLWAGCSVETWALLVRDRGWSPAQAAKTLAYAMDKALLR